MVRILPSAKLRASLVDYSFAPYAVELSGIENDFVSVGCRIQQTGRFGEVRPYLGVLLASAGYRLKDQPEPPYVVAFHESGAASVAHVNYSGEEKIVNVKARLPEKLPRLRLAAGLGPTSSSRRTRPATGGPRSHRPSCFTETSR